MRISKAGYEAIAKALASALPVKPNATQKEQHRECCLRLAYLLADRKPQFDSALFIATCGVKPK